MKTLEYIPCQIERRVPGGAGTQQDRQQLRVGKRRGALLEELLPRPFVARPVPNCHAPACRLARLLTRRISRQKRVKLGAAPGSWGAPPSASDRAGEVETDVCVQRAGLCLYCVPIGARRPACPTNSFAKHSVIRSRSTSAAVGSA